MPDTTALFAQYLNVVNKALHERSDDAPYKQLIGAGKKVLQDKEIGVAIYKDQPSAPHDFFTINFRGGSFNLLKHGKAEPDTSWKLPETHMRSVVDDPDPYIAQPAKLKLDWMKSRIGLSN